MGTALSASYFFKFFLVLCRFSAMQFVLPILGDERINIKERLMIAIFLSLIVLGLVEHTLPSYTAQGSQIAYYIVTESLIGLILGLSVKIIFSSIMILGNIISMQSGLSAATIFDPTQREQIMLFSSFILIMAIVTAVASDTHHIFITGFIESYEVFKPGFMIDIGDAANKVSRLVANSFLLAFKVSSPFLIVGMAILVASGVLSRLMPSLQV